MQRDSRGANNTREPIIMKTTTTEVITSNSRRLYWVSGQEGTREFVAECRRLFGKGYRKLEAHTELRDYCSEDTVEEYLRIHETTGQFPVVFLVP